jgi:hypothetical protein
LRGEAISIHQVGYRVCVSSSLSITADRKNATTVVVLSVVSGKASEVINRIVGTTASTSKSVLIYDDVKDEFSVAGITGISSITTTEGPAETILSGGEEGEVLTKNTSTDYDVSWQDVHTLYVQVKNDSGGTLDKGTPVHATGVTGTVADVIAARADTASAMPATYVLNEELADGAEGQAIISGTITGVDTSSFSPGDVIYVGATGGFTNVKPTGTNLIQNLGVVTKSNVNTGSGVVLGSGRANDVPNIPNGQAWIGNASGVPTPTTLATVATTGSYNDLSDQPTIPTDTNLGNTDLTLIGNRVVEMGSNSLDLQSSSASKFKIFNTGTAQGTGRFTVNGNGTAAGILRVSDASSSNIIGIQHPDSGSGYTLKLPTADGSANEFLSTDGSGNLSFASPNPNVGPWVNLGGRYQIDVADANNMLISGGAFGPYYYIWSQSAGTTVSGGTVDTTTTTMSSFYQLYGGFQLPDSLKVKASFALRNANSNSYSKPIRFQIWSFPLESVSSTVTMTLRADYTFNTPGNTYPADHTVTTTSALTADEYIVCMFAVDNATMTSTGYVYCNIQLELVE